MPLHLADIPKLAVRHAVFMHSFSNARVEPVAGTHSPSWVGSVERHQRKSTIYSAGRKTTRRPTPFRGVVGRRSASTSPCAMRLIGARGAQDSPGCGRDRRMPPPSCRDSGQQAGGRLHTGARIPICRNIPESWRTRATPRRHGALGIWYRPRQNGSWERDKEVSPRRGERAWSTRQLSAVVLADLHAQARSSCVLGAPPPTAEPCTNHPCPADVHDATAPAAIGRIGACGRVYPARSWRSWPPPSSSRRRRFAPLESRLRPTIRPPVRHAPTRRRPARERGLRRRRRPRPRRRPFPRRRPRPARPQVQRRPAPCRARSAVR